MSFDETYNKILNKNIISQDNFFESAIDWVSGKLKDTVKWTTEKLHKAIQVVFNKLSQNNEQICKKVAQSIYSLLPKDQQKQIDTIKEQLNTKEFKQYFANKIKNDYSQKEIQNMSEAQQKDLLVKYAKEYLTQTKKIISEEIITELGIIATVSIICAIILITGGGLTTMSYYIAKWLKPSPAQKAEAEAEAAKIKQQSQLEQAKQQLYLSNLQQERLNIALAN